MLRRGRLPLWNDRAGCGVPHLANGQSAVFDPFHLIAYAGSLPGAHAWMAAARLWVAGVGMFLLGRAWGLGAWGRWFSGLTFPFCGFLVVWLLYPVTNVAIWMPWLLLASDRALRCPSMRTVSWLALATGAVFFGGHIQTSAHVLLAAGCHAVWFVASRRVRETHQIHHLSHATTVGAFHAPYSESSPVTARRSILAWSAGIALGLFIAAVQIIPLGFYLAKSPVWHDRETERGSPWSLARPRILDAVCTALPYAFGSQRRGHPHLGRALGVHNLNESAGGFAGLATLVWLAPWGFAHGRVNRRVGFIAALTVVGASGAFGLPPVDNLLRALPVLGVTDNRRLTLWLAFGLVLLGGAGLDRLTLVPRRVGIRWVWVAGAILLISAALTVRGLESRLRSRARAHYEQAASTTLGADLAVFRARADRQVALTLSFLPRYYRLAAAQLLTLAALAALWRRGRIPPHALKGALLVLALGDLLGFGCGLNPAIPRGDGA
jgi:hypothetical protein